MGPTMETDVVFPSDHYQQSRSVFFRFERIIVVPLVENNIIEEPRSRFAINTIFYAFCERDVDIFQYAEWTIKIAIRNRRAFLMVN